VIDRFEGDNAVVVLDDGQSVNWPSTGLPAEATPGTAVRLTLSFDASPAAGGLAGADASPSSSGVAARLPAQAKRDAQTGQWALTLPDGSSLHWPVDAEAAAQAAAEVSLELTPDAADTAARRQRVTGLLDDIFSNPNSGQ
jgi:hypothetical protein